MEADDEIYIEEEVKTVLNLMETTWKCDAEVLQRIGALVLLWAGIDNALEMAIWALEGVDVTGAKHPAVFRGSEDRIEMFEAAAGELPGDEWQKGVRAFCVMGKQVLTFRNAIAHGVPSVEGSSINNLPKRGEVRRAPSIALLNKPVLNGVVAIMTVMIQALINFIEIAEKSGPVAASQNSECLRHLRRLRRSRVYAVMAAEAAGAKV